MENSNNWITTLKKLYVTFNKDVKGIDKYMLSNSYKRIVPYLELESLERIKVGLNEAKNKVYTIDGVLLSDEEIVELEYEKLKKTYELKTIMNSSDINNSFDNIENDKLTVVEYYFDQLKLFAELSEDKKKEQINNIKLILARISILLGIENGLYYETFLIFTELLGLKNILDNPSTGMLKRR